jgi:hypothetical protein
MNAVIIAFLFWLAFGRFFSALAFTIVWVATLIAYAAFIHSEVGTFWQGVLLVFYVGIAAQVGYFANVLLFSLFEKDPRDDAVGDRPSLLARFFRALHLNIRHTDLL